MSEAAVLFIGAFWFALGGLCMLAGIVAAVALVIGTIWFVVSCCKSFAEGLKRGWRTK